jgi:hypothetical protein
VKPTIVKRHRDGSKRIDRRELRPAARELLGKNDQLLDSQVRILAWPY